MLYLEWLLDPIGDVKLYPNKKLCLRNIVENELTILKRRDELLVRYPKSSGFASPLLLPTLVYSQDETSRFPFTNDVFKFTDGAVELDKLLLDKPDLAGIIKLVTQIFKNLGLFRDAYIGKAKGVPNVFTEGFGVLSETLEPAIPATALGAKLLVADGDTFLSKTNDLATAWGLLLEKVQSSKSNLLPYNHYAQVTAANVKTLLPPGTNSDDQAAFLELFCRTLPTHTHASPFEIDRAKLEAAARFSEWQIAQNAHSTENRLPTIFGKTAEVYLAISGERPEFAKRMSFAPIQGASDKSLGGLLRSILESLAWTKQHPHLGNAGMDLLKSVELEFLELTGLVHVPEASHDGLPPNDPKDILEGAMRVIVRQGDDYELIVDDTVLITSSGDIVAKTPVIVCRFGGFSRVEEPLKPRHSAELRRSLVYSIKADSRTILFLTDDIVRMVFEVIRKRSDARYGADSISLDAAMAECLEDRTNISQDLRNSPYFHKACIVVRCNHFTSEQIQGVDDCERVLLRWLQQFEPVEASVLLEVIAAHQCITSNNVKVFIENVDKYKTDGIVFSTKKLADQGGVQRLFTLTQEGQEIIRSLALDSAVSRIAGFKGGKESLVILAEIILSGGQLKKNFKKHYLSADETDAQYVEIQRLFEIDEFKDDFVLGLKCFRKITILVAAYTQLGADNLKEYFFTALEILPENFEVKGAALKDSACFFADTDDISAESKSAFTTLVKDMARIRSLFQVSDEHAYSKSLGQLDRANLIVRPNSVTKKGLKIFTLTPRNRHIPPLFRKTKEHE